VGYPTLARTANLCYRTRGEPRMKRPKPLTSCNLCRAPGYNTQLANGQCLRMDGTHRCTGAIQSAIGDNDWAECLSVGLLVTMVLRNVGAAIVVLVGCFGDAEQVAFGGLTEGIAFARNVYSAGWWGWGGSNSRPKV
jgi:hypothetical protein